MERHSPTRHVKNKPIPRKPPASLRDTTGKKTKGKTKTPEVLRTQDGTIEESTEEQAP